MKKDITPRPLLGTELEKLSTNPNRGFRLESYLEVATGYAYPGSQKDAIQMLDGLLDVSYVTEKPQIVQVYFYLNGYQNRDLDSKSFYQMNRYLNHCRKRHLRILLRFAYIYDDRHWDELDAPTEQILRHITQLEFFLQQNRDVLYCLQAGFLGPWGEWSGGAKQDRLTVLNHLLNHIPADLPVMVRYVWIKNVLPQHDPRRMNVGYHDDYIVSDPHQWNSCALIDSPYCAQMTGETPYLVVDGEMPWASDIRGIDGVKVVKRLAMHHFTSFSLEHNYHEDGGSYSLEEWKKIIVDMSFFQRNHLPCNPNWFSTRGGVILKRSIFDYIRDFLGYHILVESACVEQIGEFLEVSATLVNYGFAAPVAMKSCEFVLIDVADRVCAVRRACACAQLQPEKPVECRAFFPIVSGQKFHVGIRLIDAAGFGAHFANDLSFAHNINFLGDFGV
ncbi:MAG: DUF4874 domain-containing protein [Clostridiales bacterium]|nr:DUF4874 domain-containing protein [Clostridiales bacterium]